MKQVALLFNLLLSLSVFAQDKVTWNVPVKGNAKEIFFHQFTQTPLVETSDAFYGMDPGQKKIVWTLDRSSLYKTLKTLQTINAVMGSSTDMDLSEYEEIPYTPFAIICNNLINVANGQIILGDEKTAFRQWLGHDLIPELNLLLAKVTDTEGNIKLYAINFLSDKIEWETLLIDKANAKGISKLMNNVFSDALTINVFIPSANADGNIIYNNGKKLILLDGKNGKILWENECNPNTYFMSKDSKIIFAIEKRSGLGNAISLSGPKVFGRNVYCIDNQTGKNIWSAPVKLDATYVAADFVNTDRILLAHKDGFNLYDIKNGKKIWKKDYSAKNTKDVTLTPQGIEVQYGNKLMLVNTENGKKVWKKPIEFKDVDENSKFDFIRKEYKNATLMVVEDGIFAFDKKSGKRLWKRSLSKDSKIAFDDANNKVLAIDGKNIYLFDPNNQTKKVKASDIKIEEPKEICGYEIHEGKYFIFGNKEYLLLDKDGNILTHNIYKQLTGKRLAKAGLLTGKIITGILSTRIEFTTNHQESIEVGLFVPLEGAKQAEAAFKQQSLLAKQLNANEQYRKAVRTDNQYAYFLKGIKEDTGDKLSIVVVEKTTGKELHTIDFSKDRNVIYEIDSNNNQLYFIDENKFSVLDL